MEGRCDGEYGYIISVVQITNKSQGLLKATTGFAAYTVTYTCLVLRPFRGEVMDVLVTSVSKVSLFTPILQYQSAAISSHYRIEALTHTCKPIPKIQVDPCGSVLWAHSEGHCNTPQDLRQSFPQLAVYYQSQQPPGHHLSYYLPSSSTKPLHKLFIQASYMLVAVGYEVRLSAVRP